MQSPLSFSEHCTLLKTVDIPGLESRWQSEMGIHWKAPPDIQELQYWRDETTGLQFYSPPQAAGSAELYSRLQCFSWYYMDDKWEFRRALQLLKSLSPAGSRVLEVGVGQGAFLKQARDAGLQIAGLELNPDGAAAARQQGFTVFETDMASLHAADPRPWDAICAFQVLEHLPQPRSFLDQALDLLRPGGLLILSVPNAAVTQQLDPDRTDLLDQPPHHMSHWDAGVFSSLESLLPLKLRHVAFEPLAPYHISWFLGVWSRRWRRQLGPIAGRLTVNRFTIPAVQGALSLGLRQLVRGHTLLACMEKTRRATD